MQMQQETAGGSGCEGERVVPGAVQRGWVGSAV